MSTERLWDQFSGAVLANDTVSAFECAAELKSRLDTGEVPPAPLRHMPLEDWLASHPEVRTSPGAVILRTVDPSLRRISDYGVVAQDPGEGTTVLIPR